jgi:hypothetical protein
MPSQRVQVSVVPEEALGSAVEGVILLFPQIELAAGVEASVTAVTPVFLQTVPVEMGMTG